MKKVIALGGAGHIGSCGVREMVKRAPDIALEIADYNLEAAQELVKEVGGKTSAVKVDVHDREALVDLMKDADAVMSYVGPYYLLAEPIIEAAIEAKTPLVDICDDGDVTLAMFEHSKEAENAGIPIIMGLGATPGITNMMALRGAEMLDQAIDIDTSWAWTALDPKMTGPAIVDHYFHAVTGDIVTFRDGDWVKIPAMSVKRILEFSEPVGVLEASEVGHPEPATIPRYIKGVKNVSNNGVVWPQRFTDIAMFMKDIGLADQTMMKVLDKEVKARDVATSIILSLPELNTDMVEDMILDTMNRYGEFGIEGVCLRVDVKGEKGGTPMQYSYRCGGAADLLTALPAVLGTLMIVNGNVKTTGVLAPEGVIPQAIFFDLLTKSVKVEEILTRYI
jgi:saccharopine dehydrogenase-like NADP-dependent oxidoreductase